eukprot:TRINITY_DN7591_c0_g1_i1.p1 TRINITY_DN7591_c0_g1~~TRINITY_DN7591_c0_g1_i1.p1  ORF type:complete len:464 (+),score=40.99 TRINITY_DN7591_c0_g1_i1:48-1439(+)
MDELDNLLKDLGKGLEGGGGNGEVDLKALGNMGVSSPVMESDHIKNRLKERRISRRVSSKRAEMDRKMKRETSALEDLDSLMLSLSQTGDSATSPSLSRSRKNTMPATVQRNPSPLSPKPKVSTMPTTDDSLNDIDNMLGELDIAAQTPVVSIPSRSKSFSGGARPPMQNQQQQPLQSQQDLDTLLGSLHNDATTMPATASNIKYTEAMMRGMSHTNAAGPGAAKGICFTCSQPIYDDIYQALGKTFHPKCFTCGNCSTNLQSKTFFEVDGAPNCQDCYQLQFCARCGHCNKAIQGSCIEAMGKKWHPACFMCTQCMSPFGTGRFFESEGRPFCEQCFAGLFTSRCPGCNNAIIGECINACGKQWHPDHFVCTTCRKAFGNSPYYERGGMPYCEIHFHAQQGTLCACGCGKAILGRCVDALGKKYLPDHFLCAFCSNPLGGIAYTERDNNAYCNPCMGKLFGS